MPITSITIAPLPIPESLAGQAGADFTASAELANLVSCLLWGNNDFWVSPAARLEGSRANDYTATYLWAARDGDRHVGRALLELSLQDNEQNGYVFVAVHPQYRRRGIGRRLLAEAEALAGSRGRTTLQSWSEHPVGFKMEGQAMLQAETGYGSAPAASPAVRFATSSGFQLEQVDRCSRMPIPADAGRLIGQVESAAARAAGSYRLVEWADSCPPEYLDQYAVLRQRMSTDAPLGELDYEEEVWDAVRVRHKEENLKRMNGRSLVVAVQHAPTGDLVGHTVLEWFPEQPEVVYQEDTLVLRAHRGHRLGLWLKARNLQRVAESWPQGRRLYTWNAAENSHMLDINLALGFAPAGDEAAWQKKLPARPEAG
ncbi:GNAT family N-acetyltransferase [Arthrobacter sp. CAU 1506]|uniref:GNAT family N-acetyltransferase n=1 Tax=Arthrobacter sp. CAU 1506 TaxID=2560052 RepID=UPI00145C998B|nr:GNAT family N-acetyltransferase [Arthrobacter sp. CAU 1506]